jgi:hypothetical protein
MTLTRFFVELALMVAGVGVSAWIGLRFVGRWPSRLSLALYLLMFVGVP